MIKEDRIQELEEQIRYHNELYFNQQPEITDAEYDALVEELKKLNPTSAALQEVGALPSYGRRVKHELLMGSLDKVTFEKDDKGNIVGKGMKFLNKWVNDRLKELGVKESDIGWSMKMDGCAVELVYKKGNLVEASTRGNGHEGMDITDNVRNISTIPTKIDSEDIKKLLFLDNLDCELRFRGEMYLPRSVFRDKWQGVFANPRNAVSGGLLCKNPEQTGQYGFKFMAYDLFINNKEPDDEHLKAHYVDGVKGYHGISEANLEFVEIHDGVLSRSAIDELDDKREDFDYETDGIVFSFLAKNDREKLGWQGSCPKGRVAFKFMPEQQKTQVRDITWQPGRTGRLTPVAELEPVKVAGSLISRCTLHNLSEVRRLDVAKGDKVLIQKSGDIIPQVVRVLEREGKRDINYPEQCPICESFTSNDDVNVWCENMSCGSKLHQNILNYLGVLEVKEVGSAMVQALIDEGHLKAIEDLYKLDIEDVLSVPHAGIRTAETVINAIISVNQVELGTLLYALGIHNLGSTTAKTLAKTYKTLEAVRKATVEELVNLPDIGDIIANSIVKGLRDMAPTIDELEKVLDIIPYQEKTGVFKGKRFCCTGALQMKRKDVQKLIEEAGGEYSSINKDLDYLIIGEGAVPAKVNKAAGFGAEVIEESQFKELIRA